MYEYGSAFSSVQPRRSPGRARVFASLPAFAAIVMLVLSTQSSATDIALGEKAFKAKCAICHETAPGRGSVGPNLAGIVNRSAGSIEDYAYSPAMRAANLTWDPPTLERYLADPRGTVPGTKMTFAGDKNEQERADLIAYLASLK
jgi:cytochrome c